MWSAVADGWGDNADFIDARGAHLNERMLGATAPAAGDRVLELACGVGGPGFAAAALVGPTGSVVVSDVAPEMTAIATQRARALGLTVDVRVRDLEQIDEPDRAYDVVLCREGLMLVADPALAVGEIRRVLAPGGRVAIAVWAARERNPWLGVVFDVVSAQLGMPLPPPGLPHPFSLDDPDRLRALLADAGLADVAIDDVDAPYDAASVDEWWDRTAAMAGPLSQVIGGLPEDAARELRGRAHEAIAPYRTGDGALHIPGVSLLASARAPEA